MGSAALLQFMSTNHPDFLLEITYTFVFGELSDAFQNRHIPHAKRMKMALHAQYFLDMWETYFGSCGYDCSQHFISREAVDIARMLIEGLISLIIIYCDHVPGHYPLLPWMHSTGPCEHTFGESHYVVPDFTMLDSFYMQPKLSVKVQEAVLRGISLDLKACTSGYCHTYFNNHGIDLATLSVFPSDDDINHMGVEAVQEAESLVKLLSVSPEQLWARRAANLITIVPSVHTLHMDLNSEDDDDSIYGEKENDAEELQCLIDRAGHDYYYF